MAQVHEKERQLTREVAQTVEQGLPGVEVLAVELNGPERLTVYIDHATGVDHGLCERVTNLLRGYLDRYTVASRRPGSSGRSARLRISGARSASKVVDPHRHRARTDGRSSAAPLPPPSTKDLALDVADGERVTIPYDAIVRGNLVDEGER